MTSETPGTMDHTNILRHHNWCFYACCILARVDVEAQEVAKVCTFSSQDGERLEDLDGSMGKGGHLTASVGHCVYH